MQIIVLIIYAIISVAGVTFVKLGSGAPLSFAVGSNGITFGVGWLTLLGLLLYVISFLVYMTLVAKSNLTYLTPVSSGMVYVLTLIVSLTLFKEQITPTQWMGWCLIIGGVILMNIRK